MTHKPAPLSVDSTPRIVTSPSSAPKPTFTIPPENSEALFVGDSYTEGSGASTARLAWAHLVSKQMGWKATYAGVGGTGFTWGGGDKGDDGETISERVVKLSKREGLQPKVVVLQGGQNDWRADADIVAVSVADAVGLARKAWPDATVIVFGPAAPQPLATSIERIDASVEEGAIEADALSINPARGRWFTANNSREFDFDTAHVNDGGHALIADRFIAALEKFENGQRRI